MASVYIPPENSPYSNKIDYFEVLSKEVAYYASMGEIMLMGDFNSRMGHKLESHVSFRDIINDDTKNMDLYLTMNNQKESAQLMERNNSDTIINKQGKELLDLINSAHLVITNGRVPGDLSGHLTCHKYNGSSVVDYCIVSNAIFKNVISMQVYPHEWYSDHSPIGVSM